MKKHTCALVLAAGFSKRFGSDKRFSGSQALILRSLKNIINNYDDIYLVHRNNDDKLKELLKDLPLILIKTTNNNISLGTSISSGIKYIINSDKKYETCAIFLADMPFIKNETIQELKLSQKKNLIIRVNFDNKPGHPVIFGSDFFEELADLQNQEGASSVIKKNILNIKNIKVNDKGVIEDIDYSK